LIVTGAENPELITVIAATPGLALSAFGTVTHSALVPLGAKATLHHSGQSGPTSAE
jgi:hypothetical protein